MTATRIGLVGCGRHSFHIIAPILLEQGVKLAAVCDIDQAALERFTHAYRSDAACDDYRELLARDDLDALVVVTGPESHARIAMEAMDRGLNVFVEKTPCSSTKEAKDVAECEKQTGRFTMVGFNRRYATAYRMARGVAVERAPVYLMQTRYHAQNYGNEDRFILGHLIHHMDLARFFLGEIDDVQTLRVSHGPGALGYSINLKARSGAIANIQSASLLNFNYPQESLQIMGAGWEVVVDNHQELRYNRDDRPAAGRSLLAGMTLDESRESLIWSPNRTMFPPVVWHDQGFRAELAEFLACVREGRTPETTMADAAMTMALMEQFGRSLSAET